MQKYADYLKTVHQRFVKILVIAGRALQHGTVKVRKHLKTNGALKQRYLLRGSHLDAIEECRYQAKQDLLVSRYYDTFTIMQQMMSEYFQTKWFHLGILEYYSRKILVRKDI